jgi:hypothetical protein
MLRGMATFMDPRAAADVLRGAIAEPTKAFTVADAAAQSGLALRDVENGLSFLSHEYRGRLRVGEKGDLLHYFPTGFEKPWETRERFQELGRQLLAGVVGVGRFIVRAWVAIVLVGYALLFLAIVIASAFSGSRDSNNRGGIGAAGLLFRLVADAMFWTFRPFSSWNDEGTLADRGEGASAEEGAAEEKVPFYEKVNRFLFGPPARVIDPLERQRRIVQEIRAQRGRIGLADVMRVSGLDRAEADPLMARLMLDYDGTVEVSEEGGIFYVFQALRRSAQEAEEAAPAQSVWDTPNTPPALTGNGPGDDILIGFLNLFNLGASAYAMSHALTLENLFALLTARKGHPPIFVDSGLPLVLGLVPFVFSAALFLLPLGRALTLAQRARRSRQESGRRAILKVVLETIRAKRPVTDEALVGAYRAATGEAPESGEITRRVVDLGGDVDMKAAEATGAVRYRFVDLETEAAALEEERSAAPEEERRVGRVVFSAE